MSGMSKNLIRLTLSLAAMAAVSGCVAYPAPRPPPPGIAYVAPVGIAPASGYVWHYHARYGWGWWHPRYGWYRGWG